MVGTNSPGLWFPTLVIPCITPSWWHYSAGGFVFWGNTVKDFALQMEIPPFGKIKESLIHSFLLEYLFWQSLGILGFPHVDNCLHAGSLSSTRWRWVDLTVTLQTGKKKTHQLHRYILEFLTHQMEVFREVVRSKRCGFLWHVENVL